MTVERPVEIELKYTVADRTIGERLLNAETLAGFRANGAPRPTQHEDRYVDSADGALARAGFAARLRTAGNETIVSVKSTAVGNGSLHRREELEGPADRTSDVAGWPPSAARSLILELCGDAPLVELVTVRQFRRRRDLELPNEDCAVELSLDEVDVVARGRVVERFLELELELKRGSSAGLAPLQALLDGHHGLSPAPGSKLERALVAARRSGPRRPPTPARPAAGVVATRAVAQPDPAGLADGAAPTDTAGLDVEMAPVASDEPTPAASQPQAEAAPGPEAADQPEAASEPEAVIEPEAAPQPEATIEPEAVAQSAFAAQPAATSQPAVTAQPEVAIPIEVVHEPEAPTDTEAVVPSAPEAAPASEAAEIPVDDPVPDPAAGGPVFEDGVDEDVEVDEANHPVDLGEDLGTDTDPPLDQPQAMSAVEPEPLRSAERPKPSPTGALAPAAEKTPEDGPVEGRVIDLEALEDAPELIEEAAAVAPTVLGSPVEVELAGEIPVGKTPGVTADDLHAEAGRKVIRFHLARMIAREAGTRDGADPEELHGMRVSTRRMRAAWRVFGDGFRADRTTRFRKRLRIVAARLGTVRDLDVLIEAIEAFAATLPAGERDGLDPLLASWREQRDAGRRLLINELDSGGYQHFLEDYRDFAVTPGAAVRPVDPTTPHRVRDTAGARIWQAYERVRAYESVLKWADVPTLHQLRIEAKRLRYTLEFVREALGPEAPALISRVVALQDHLGAMNDAEIAAHMARAFLVEHAGDLTDHETSAISRYLVFREREVARLKRTVGVPWRSVAGLTFRRALGRTIATL